MGQELPPQHRNRQVQVWVLCCFFFFIESYDVKLEWTSKIILSQPLLP